MDEKKKQILIMNFYADSLDENLKKLDTILNICNSIQSNRQILNDSFTNERLHHCNLLYQKAFLHGHSIEKLANGILINSLPNRIPVKINDPFSINILLRSLIETYLALYFINIMPNDNTSKDLSHSIWIYYGLNQRQKADFSKSVLKEQANKKKNDEKQMIYALEQQITNSIPYQRLNSEKKISLIKHLKKDWKIMFIENSFKQLSYQDIINAIGIRHDLFINFYNFLSWNTHSTVISILQLSDLYNGKKLDEEFVSNAVLYTFLFLAFMTRDLVYNDNGYNSSYQKLELELKDVLNFVNIYFRGDRFSLELLDINPASQ
jgi:hypothetical protein